MSHYWCPIIKLGYPNITNKISNKEVKRESGGDEGDRTPDLNAASVALSQLSYVPGRVGGVPKGIRTPVAGVKGRCPRPTRRWGPINKQIIMKES